MPRLVKSWAVIVSAELADAVGPPWLVTTRGGSSPSGARKRPFRGA